MSNVQNFDSYIKTFYCDKPIDSINLLDSQRRCDLFLVSYGQTYRVELILNKRQVDGYCPELWQSYKFIIQIHSDLEFKITKYDI
jgi:hypothetical protein